VFACYREDLTDQAWLDVDDANLLEDFGWGCSLFTMAKRACRSEADVLARLAALGRSIEQQPPARKIRNTTWTRRA
jgi:hypothetical protein